MATYQDALHDHVAGFFGHHRCRACDWSESGRVTRMLPDFHVLEFAPGPRTQRWTYVTVGAGQQPPANVSALEFVLCAPSAHARHVELLFMTTHYHLTGEALDEGHTLPIGEPWLSGSGLDCLLVCRPYPFGPALENFHRKHLRARILWLLPIAGSERRHAKAHGLEALESLFDRHHIDYADPCRKAVVP